MIRVTALDADEGNNAAVSYNIVDGAGGKFIIEGKIKTQFLVKVVGSLSFHQLNSLKISFRKIARGRRLEHKFSIL